MRPFKSELVRLAAKERLCRRSGTGCALPPDIGSCELSHQSGSGSAENCNGSADTHLDLVTVQYVLDFNLIVIEKLESNRAPIQDINVTDLDRDTYIDQAELAEYL